MSAEVSSKQVEDVLRALLVEAGYSVNAERKNGETGTDIEARRHNEAIHIEAIAFKSSPPARSKDFYEAFFRSISRLGHGATRCVIALPARFGMGLRQRANTYDPAWKRLGDAFPELEVWLVDTVEKKYKRTSWTGWLEGERLL
jgi:hypothetical protein